MGHFRNTSYDRHRMRARYCVLSGVLFDALPEAFVRRGARPGVL